MGDRVDAVPRGRLFPAEGRAVPPPLVPAALVLAHDEPRAPRRPRARVRHRARRRGDRVAAGCGGRRSPTASSGSRWSCSWPWKGRVVAGGVRRRRPNRGMAVALAVADGRVAGVRVRLCDRRGGGPWRAGETLCGCTSRSRCWPSRCWRGTWWRGRSGRGARTSLDGSCCGPVLLAALRRGRCTRRVEAVGCGSPACPGVEAAVHRLVRRSTRRRTPVASWLDDAVPDIDGAAVAAGGDRRRGAPGHGAGRAAPPWGRRPCARPWTARRAGTPPHDWTGVPAARGWCASGPSTAASGSGPPTGFDRWLPLSDLDTLLLATSVRRCGPLAAGPRLPGTAGSRRDAAGSGGSSGSSASSCGRRPWWAQSPFPYT